MVRSWEDEKMGNLEAIIPLIISLLCPALSAFILLPLTLNLQTCTTNLICNFIKSFFF